MNGFKIFGVTVRLDFTFFAFNAVVLLLRDAGLIYSFYTVCAVHEFGHILAIMVTREKIASAELSGLGIRINTEKSGIAPIKSSLFILLSGPAANLLLFFLLKGVDCGGELPMLSLTAAIYNMLPYKTLDGGAIIGLFTSGAVCERAAEYVLLAVKLAVTAALAALAFALGNSAVPPLIASVILLISDLLQL